MTVTEDDDRDKEMAAYHQDMMEALHKANEALKVAIYRPLTEEEIAAIRFAGRI